MMSDDTLTNVSIDLANILFHERCDRLDEIIDGCISKAFDGERISLERKKRIINKFVKLMIEAANE